MFKIVFGPRPYISEERTGVLVISGVNIDVGSSAVNISCSTYSVLPTQLTWSSRNEDNSIPSGISLISLGAQVLNLVWTRPSLYTDSGEYMCTATNTRGSNTATINLLVSSEYFSIYSLVSISYSVLTVSSQHLSTFHCREHVLLTVV